ncbi:MAG TPA: alpha/beta fold hydrolase [Gemmataceae bacterium]|nr:alpha/beta fold hydrolase [Gemmataceae bacterium]
MLPYVLAVLVAVPVFFVLGDLGYTLLTRRRYRRWEAGIERDALGVRAGCSEFTLGEGEDGVLLIHGFGDSPAIFQRIAPALAAKGFHCRGIRLPQHGLPMAQYLTTSAVQWRDAVRAAIAGLRRRRRRVFVVAHSMGAAVAVEAVADPTAKVDGMALLAPLFDVSNKRSPLLPARVWFRLLDPLLLLTKYVGVLDKVDLWDQSALPIVRDDKFVPRVVIREVFGLMDRNRKRAKEFRTPLLMILARHDLVVDNAAAERFFNDCAAQPKRLLWAEGAGHMLPIDFGWEERVDQTVQFFRNIVGEPETTTLSH